jgi:HlyD family type I secretion membrane fusion protein
MARRRVQGWEDPDTRDFRIGGRVLAGTALAVVLVAGAGGWAATARLSGAVIAQGAVTVEENLKSIQHRDGGIVSEIAVREGDRVRSGQVLIRLDDARTRAELAIVRAQLVELAAKRARLLAERDGLPAIELPRGFAADDPEVAGVVQGETRLFAGNRAELDSRRQQLELGIEQIAEEILGLEAQRASKRAEIGLVEAEHARIAELARQGLTETARVYAIGRERARLDGERGEIDAAIARAGARTGEVRLQIIALGETARTEAQRELSLVETRLAELGERRGAIEDQLARTDIRAPIDGTVNELNIHTIGGVITPAEVLVTVVPADAALKVEVRLPPVSIDQVAVGRPARLRFPAFNQRTTPELLGDVAHVSPATARDAATGESYYLADIAVSAAELARLGADALLPGMPVEVYITTEERTALSYLVKPLTDQFARAFRER